MLQKSKNLMEDINRTLTIPDRRRKAIDDASNAPLPTSYKVNENAKFLHPNFIKAKISKLEKLNKNITLIEFKNDENKFPFFRGGEYITVSKNINGKVLTRPYSICSSPKDALKGILQIAVSDAGYFSHELVNSKVNDDVILSEPSGNFYHDDLRNKNTILGIAGGYGITPFISMMKSIIEGTNNYKLNLVIGVKTLDDLFIDVNDYTHPNIHIEVVLSNENRDGYAYGFIDEKILSKYDLNNSSIFMCGPDMMYEFVTKELTKLDVKQDSIRLEHNRLSSLNEKEEFYEIRVKIRSEIFVIKASSNETLACAFDKAGIIAPLRCEGGVCGFCHSKLISGKYFVDPKKDYRREADLKFKYIHPCVTYPRSNMEIDVPPLDILKELK